MPTARSLIAIPNLKSQNSLHFFNASLISRSNKISSGVTGEGGAGADSCFLILFTAFTRSFLYFTNLNSIRLFIARFSAEVFGTRGCISPNPFAVMREAETPFAINHCMTDFARASESF